MSLSNCLKLVPETRPNSTLILFRKQLSYVYRDFKYASGLKATGYVPNGKEGKLLQTIEKVYEQQEHMYKDKTHLVTDRVEKISFDAYDECSCLKDAAERYREHVGHYPMRIPADQIYWIRKSRSFCKGNRSPPIQAEAGPAQ